MYRSNVSFSVEVEIEDENNADDNASIEELKADFEVIKTSGYEGVKERLETLQYLIEEASQFD